jgi:saccharopine dehydrogenase (NAD+, L-lysine-forming)
MMYHDELESIARFFPTLKRARFWMTFSDNYLNHLAVLKNVGMTAVEPIVFNGQSIVPIQFLKALLPDPASLGALTKGKTCIGCLVSGVKNGQTKTVFIYNVCDHQESFNEVKSQAISYTTGVPAMIAAKLIAEGIWKQSGVWNLEQLDPDPFMEDLNCYGLPWKIIDVDASLMPS